MTSVSEVRRPLAGFRVLDLVDGPLGPATRYLAELGATVVHLTDAPCGPLDTHEGLSAFVAHMGKEWVVANPGVDLDEEMDKADAIVVDMSRGLGAARQWDVEDLRARHPRAVVVTCGNFGLGNSFTGWAATDPVLHALSGELSRSGIRGKPPLLPPSDLAFQCAAVQLAYVILIALYHRQQTGGGDHVDFSALDGAMAGLDPGYGISGSATMGRPASLLSPDRPPRGYQYPIFPCADGHVRICLLAARQWRGMFEWMGRPDEFSAPEFEKVAVRYKSRTLLPAIGAFFANQTRNELEAAARKLGVPLSALLESEEAIASEHFRERLAFAEIDAPGFGKVPVPNGVIEIDGHRMTATPAAPGAVPLPRLPAPTLPGLPLSGLKVLDLGVIVVGAEQGRLLADMGADVVKVESRDFPDGTRQADPATGLSVTFAAGHRNKRSLGLNLRHPEGRGLFMRLVAEADIILTNFKPGTMESLGLGYDRLSEINPRMIMVESSAFGATGPWATRMGYGPLVRAATGLTSQWRYAGDPEGFSDSITIYPDHVAGRITIVGVLALLIDRARTGRGGLVGSSQAELVLAHQAFQIAAARTGLPDPTGPCEAPWGIFRAAGEDDWCVVTVRHDGDWERLCSVVGGLEPGLSRHHRLERREAIEEVVAGWVAARPAREAMAMLQAAGVPAGEMLRVADLPGFDYFAQRGIFRLESHPYLPEPYHVEAMHAKFGTIAPPPARPAPLAGEHTAEVMRDWLDLDEDSVEDFVASGVLEPPNRDIRDLLAGVKGEAVER